MKETMKDVANPERNLEREREMMHDGKLIETRTLGRWEICLGE